MQNSQPIFVDEEILREAVMEKLSQDQAKHIAKMEGIHFNDVLELHLQFRKILKIDHMWGFTSLTKLNMKNNLIKKIEGLDCLLNLTWLNLSFNKIEKIEGLESLLKLEVVNLSNNRISVIENLDPLEKVTHFCIADNLIGQLNNVLYLKRFKNLFALSLTGNPVSEEDDYKCFITAYFPNLRCLDYKLIDAKTKNEASIKYRHVLEEMRHEEQQTQVENVEQSRKADLELHRDAFVEFLNGPYLFESMFKDDPDAEILQCFPGVAVALQTFKSQMTELCMQIFEIGLAEHERRQAETNSFFSGQTKAVTHYQQKASQILAHFEQQHKEVIVELQQLSDPDILMAKISRCNDEISQLCNSLMALEFQMVGQLEDIIKKLDESISDMVGNFSETVQGIFTQCRDLEDHYHEKVREIVTTLENVIKDKPEEDIPDDVKILYTDKAAVMDALTASHDNHLLTIGDRETLLVTQLNAWKAALIKGIQDKELKQNRMRISDIHRYVDHLREQLEEIQQQHQ